MHLLPKGFHRIRHYGFLSNGRCKAMVTHIRKLLSAEETLQLKQKVVQDQVGAPCPVCGKGLFIPIVIAHRFGYVLSSAMSRLYSNQPVWDTS